MEWGIKIVLFAICWNVLPPGFGLKISPLANIAWAIVGGAIAGSIIR